MVLFFRKPKRVVEVDGKQVELGPKPHTGVLSFLNKTRATQPAPAPTQQAAHRRFMPKIEIPKLSSMKPQLTVPSAPQAAMGLETGPAAAPVQRSKNPLQEYARKIAAKNRNLETQLREQHINSSPEVFVERMLVAAAMLAAVIAVVVIIALSQTSMAFPLPFIFGIVIGAAVFQQGFKVFLSYPSARKANNSKNIERDILFAARDMIISLRSGMPLFNALTSISTGYGDASKEFEKVVDRVQLGMPLEEAIDATIAETKSPSFRKLMLQASVSIKAGADVVGALQSVIDQLSQERVIALRAYGQRLNALAMFYMLFGVIGPSMGIAVVTILTTFIALFTVTTQTLELVLVGIVVLQIVFMKMITASRPVFSM